MALTVWPLAGFPAINMGDSGAAHGMPAFRSPGTPTVQPLDGTLAYTNGAYTPSGTTYVAGILDAQGVNPSRIFYADNGTGFSSVGTVPLPTLVSITQVTANGQSLAELPSNYSSSVSFNEYTPKPGLSGFLVLLSAAVASADDGVYPLGYDNATRTNPNVPGWTSQGGNYNATGVTVAYPNPQMRFFVTTNAILLIASTAQG